MGEGVVRIRNILLEDMRQLKAVLATKDLSNSLGLGLLQDLGGKQNSVLINYNVVHPPFVVQMKSSHINQTDDQTFTNMPDQLCYPSRNQ